MGKCKYSLFWSAKTDPNGNTYGQWLEKQDDQHGFCKLCNKSINISSNGIKALVQHCQTDKHKKMVDAKLSSTQLKIAISTSSSASTSSGDPDQSAKRPGPSLNLNMYSTTEQVTKAEILWALKTVASNLPAISCDGIGEVFQAMFGNCEIAKKFSMSRTKLGYMVTEALGPFFHKLLLEDASQSYYTLAYDETTNYESEKELQIRIRYWSHREKKIVSYHLETFFLGTADAETVLSYINRSILDNSLCKSKLLMLASDGPNTNKKVYRLMNEEVTTLRSKSLLDIGSCDLHIVHNAFLKGITCFGEDVQDFVINIYYFFHGWPQRQEDYKMIQVEVGVPPHKIIKHTSTRWLSLKEATERILEQLPAIRNYFLKYIPLKRTSLQTTNKYKIIREMLCDKLLLPKLHFIVSSATTFVQFTKFFQKDEPLIHVLYDELSSLLTVILLKILKENSIRNIKNFSHININNLFNQGNYLDLKHVDVGQDARDDLTDKKYSDKDRLLFFKAAQSHYIEASKHLILKSALNIGSFLKSVSILQPGKIQSSNAMDILYVAEKLPLDIDKTNLSNEWNLLKSEQILNEANANILEERIDNFWNKLMTIRSASNLIKYPNVSRIVQACLSLSHGSSDVERGFSTSKNILCQDRTAMSLRTLNAKLRIIDGIKRFDSTPSRVPITKELITMARLAHSNYVSYLEEEKRKKVAAKEETERQKQEKLREEQKIKDATLSRQTVENLQLQVEEHKKEVAVTEDAADSLFENANTKLKNSLKAGDLKGAKAAQELLDSYVLLKQQGKEKLEETEKIEKRLNKRRNELIDTFISKKKR